MLRSARNLATTAAFLSIAALTIGVPVQAATDVFNFEAPHQWLAAEQAAGPTQAIVYALSRALLPLCEKSALWSFGPGAMGVVEPTEKTPKVSLQWRAALQAEFGVPDGRVVLAIDVPGSPLAKAGLQVGDHWPIPAAQRTGESSQPGPKDPVREIMVTRNGQTLAVRVTEEPTCGLRVRVLNSEFPYAENNRGFVMVTLPLLASLNERQLVMAVTSEASLSIFKGAAGAQFVGDMIGTVMLGRFAGFGSASTNRETHAVSPHEDALIRADLLTLWLLSAWGISPAEFQAFLKEMDHRSPSRLVSTNPSYSLTRPPLGPRMRELHYAQRAVDNGQSLPLPADVSPEALAIVTTRLAESVGEIRKLGAATHTTR